MDGWDCIAQVLENLELVTIDDFMSDETTACTNSMKSHYSTAQRSWCITAQGNECLTAVGVMLLAVNERISVTISAFLCTSL